MAGRKGGRGRQTSIPRAVQTALIAIEREGQCSVVADSLSRTKTGWIWAKLHFTLDLPTAARRVGQTAEGVRQVESILIAFPPRFPMTSPRFYLRQDFPRSFQHLQPRDFDQLVEPCISDDNLNDTFAREGVAGLVHRMRVWLERAVRNELMNPDQPWEAIRRDNLDGRLVVSHALLIETAQKRWPGEFTVFAATLQSMSQPNNRSPLQIVVEADATPITRESALEWLKGRFESIENTLCIAISVGRNADDSVFVSREYAGENVLRLPALYERAAGIGVEDQLRGALSELAALWPGSPIDWPLALVLVAKRPRRVAGSHSEFELLPYTFWASKDDFFDPDDANIVAPMGLFALPDVDMLRSLSGVSDDRFEKPLCVIGCGSLGSKLAMHEMRRGSAPATIIDSRYFLPHNGARHALTPLTGLSAKSWPLKATEIASLAPQFGQSVEGIVRDLVDMVGEPASRRKLDPGAQGIIFNTTASHRVRIALAASTSGDQRLRARVAEAAVAAAGSLWLFTVEGSGRTPTTLDLYVEWLRHHARNPIIREIVEGRSAQRVDIGQGCGTLTVTASDAAISRAAGAAACLCADLRRGGQTTGWISVIDARDAISATAIIDETVGSYLMIAPIGALDWAIRLAPRVVEAIDQDVAQWPRVETGGYLVGHVDQAAQIISVVDCESAPPGSIRSNAEFVLAPQSKRGLPELSSHALKRVGTWHSHLSDTGPSGTDRASARRLELAEREPRTLVIRTPRRWHALLAQPR